MTESLLRREGRAERTRDDRIFGRDGAVNMSSAWFVCFLRYFPIAALLLLAGRALTASEHRGQVVFGGVAVPGTTVTATQGEKKLASVTDGSGIYNFPDLTDGLWSVKVEMLTFAPQTKEIGIAPGAPAAIWELTLLPLEGMNAVAAPHAPPPDVSASKTAAAPADSKKAGGKKGNDKKKSAAATNPQASFQRADLAASAPSSLGEEQNGLMPADADQNAVNPYVVNGSASTGIERRVIGNNRRTFRRYNGALNFVVDNSALDARPFSMTGQDTHRSPYNHGQYTATFGGPLFIPGIIKRNAQFTVIYTAGRNRNSSTLSGLMPSSALRRGDFTQALTPLGTPVVISDPTTGFPFPDNSIPDNRIANQAKALLGLYPSPSSPLASGYNYQIGAKGVSNSDNVQARANKTLSTKNYLTVNFAWTRSNSTSPSIFGFIDDTQMNGVNTRASWTHRFGTRLMADVTYDYSRSATLATPYFAFRRNVSGEAEIAGNNQDPANYGPPTLSFASGITGLSDGQQAFTRNSTSGLSFRVTWMRSPHNFEFVSDFRRQQFNLLTQQDARGTLTFTGTATQSAPGSPAAATGSDFADFLLGIPDTVSIAYGNADKYLRANMWDAGFKDDWRVLPGFTMNYGVRWEYNSPISERYGRLVNLDVMPGYTAVQPVLGSNPIGGLTGQRYPGSLVRPDKHAFQPRVGIAWHPFAGGSMVVRGGYGVYYNTSVYQSLAMQMAQQSPLSKSLSVANSAATPLTLANPFQGTPISTANTFAIDPDYQVGYAQNWQVQMQQDVTASMVMTLTYLGIKGTRGTQVFLPNTYPDGAVNPCPACPSGFKYWASNGNSTRQAGTLQLRRRLHSGIAAAVQYTYSHSLDDAMMAGQGGQFIAQDWLNLRAERGPSNFDQRHLLSVTAQYTSGMGLAGGALLRGWKGAALKGWTLQTTVTAGTGLPLTPVYFSAVRGTGVTGSLRPQATGLPVDAAVAGRALNPAAYSPPPVGQWGNAGRNSITGPSQFMLNASLGRSFNRLDIRFDSTNALNHVTYPSWITTIGSAQFGLPAGANGMRTVQATVRWRY